MHLSERAKLARARVCVCVCFYNSVYFLEFPYSLSPHFSLNSILTDVSLISKNYGHYSLVNKPDRCPRIAVSYVFIRSLIDQPLYKGDNSYQMQLEGQENKLENLLFCILQTDKLM